MFRSSLTSYSKVDCNSLTRCTKLLDHSNNIPSGLYNYGRYKEKDNAKEAKRYYSQAAQQGYAPAMYALGRMHEHGWGGFQSNSHQALRHYELAAEQGEPLAYYRLGEICRQGLYDHKINHNQAARYFRNAFVADQLQATRSPVLRKSVTEFQKTLWNLADKNNFEARYCITSALQDKEKLKKLFDEDASIFLEYFKSYDQAKLRPEDTLFRKLTCLITPKDPDHLPFLEALANIALQWYNNDEERTLAERLVNAIPEANIQNLNSKTNMLMSQFYFDEGFIGHQLNMTPNTALARSVQHFVTAYNQSSDLLDADKLFAYMILWKFLKTGPKYLSADIDWTQFDDDLKAHITKAQTLIGDDNELIETESQAKSCQMSL